MAIRAGVAPSPTIRATAGTTILRGRAARNTISGNGAGGEGARQAPHRWSARTQLRPRFPDGVSRGIPGVTIDLTTDTVAKDVQVLAAPSLCRVFQPIHRWLLGRLRDGHHSTSGSTVHFENIANVKFAGISPGAMVTSGSTAPSWSAA